VTGAREPKPRSRPRLRTAAAPPPPPPPPPGKAPSLDPVLSARLLARVRKLCLALPGASERSSHGSPSFFLDGKRSFASFSDNHHHDGRIALVCAAPEGAQAMLVDANPDCYFVPPYVGRLGWIGVRLDRDLPWSEIGALIEAAHAARGGRR